MVTWLEKPQTDEEIYTILHPLVKKWFQQKFKTFSLPQKYGIMPIHSRENILISSPTGSGKTLTGFGAILNELVDSAEKGILEDKVYCIYLSPLKALGADIQVNLLEPLEEIEALSKKDHGIRVAVRTGDTTAYQRQKMAENVPHILITTPESLALLLVSKKFRPHLRAVDWVVIDEIHSFAENKRGVQLSLLLEQLQAMNPGIARVGLSATVAPLEEIARYLAGANRDCKLVDISYLKELDMQVISPVPDLVNTEYKQILDKTYEALHELIQSHKTTLIFTNTRAGTERVVHTLKQRFPGSYYEIAEKPPFTHASLIGAHHGSLSKVHRFDIEQKLRDGKLKAVVCSTSLELGIDIGSIDLVILLGSPKSVARALQRTGRAGHQLHALTKGRLIVTDRDDLVECSVLLKNALERKIDRIHIPENALDVLVQHILGYVLDTETTIEDLYALTKESYCYRDLAYENFVEIVKYLAGDFQTLENRSIFAKIFINEDSTIRARGKLTRMIYTSNLGTIPSSGGVVVKVGDSGIGMIDESFLERLKRGDTFVLGGDVYEFKFARGMVAQVSAAYNRTPTVPQWFSEMLPLNFDLAQSIQTLRTRMYELFKENKTKKEILAWLHTYLYVNDVAAEALYAYMEEQYAFLKEFPRSSTIVVEAYHDDFLAKSKKHYLIVHSLHGRRANEALSRVFAYALGKFHHKDIEVGLNDNGFYLASTTKLDLAHVISLIEPEEFRLLLKTSLERTEIVRRRFRQCAERAFMILRSYKGKTKRTGKQQVSSQILYKAAEKISKDFVIIREALREVLEDAMDIDNAEKVFQDIKKGAKKLRVIETTLPSPFATNLMLQGFSDIISVEDRHAFLQQMHTLALAKIGREVVPRKTPLVQEKKEKISDAQKEVLNELKKVKNIPPEARNEIAKMIKNVEPDAFIVQELERNKNMIRVEWPQNLADFVLAYLEDNFDAKKYWKETKPIDYENFWDMQKRRTKEKKESEAFLLRKELVIACKKRNVPYDVVEQLVQSLDGKVVGKKTKEFFATEFEKAIHKVWTDRVVKHIKKCLKQK